MYIKNSYRYQKKWMDFNNCKADVWNIKLTFLFKKSFSIDVQIDNDMWWHLRQSGMILFINVNRSTLIALKLVQIYNMY